MNTAVFRAETQHVASTNQLCSKHVNHVFPYLGFLSDYYFWDVSKHVQTIETIETIQRIWRWHGEFMIEGQFQTLLKRFWLLYWARGTTSLGSRHVTFGWLMVWNINFMTFHPVGNFIIPTDELHDFSEGLKPPTRQ